MRKPQFQWKTVKAVALVAIIIPLIVILVPQFLPWFADLSDNSKHFGSALGASFVGIIIYFLKKKLEEKIKQIEEKNIPIDSKKIKEISDSKELILTAEIYEIFLFMILPAIAFYAVIPDQIHENPWWITGIFLIVVVIWFIIIQIPITNQYKSGEGKIVKTHADTLFGYMMGLGVLFTILIYLFQSYS